MFGSDRAVVVVPAYNEEATVGTVVTGIRASGLPVVVVDDKVYGRMTTARTRKLIKDKQ